MLTSCDWVSWALTTESISVPKGTTIPYHHLSNGFILWHLKSDSGLALLLLLGSYSFSCFKFLQFSYTIIMIIFLWTLTAELCSLVYISESTSSLLISSTPWLSSSDFLSLATILLHVHQLYMQCTFFHICVFTYVRCLVIVLRLTLDTIIGNTQV